MSRCRSTQISLLCLLGRSWVAYLLCTTREVALKGGVSVWTAEDLREGRERGMGRTREQCWERSGAASMGRIGAILCPEAELQLNSAASRLFFPRCNWTVDNPPLITSPLASLTPLHRPGLLSPLAGCDQAMSADTGLRAQLLFHALNSPSPFLAGSPRWRPPTPHLPRVPLVRVMKLSVSGWEPDTGQERGYERSRMLHSSQRSLCSLPAAPRGGSVLRSPVCSPGGAVLPDGTRANPSFLWALCFTRGLVRKRGMWLG